MTNIFGKYRIQIGWQGKKAVGGAFKVGNVNSKVAPAIDSVGYATIGYPFESIYGGPYDDVSGSGAYQATEFTITREIGSNHIGIGKVDLTLNDKWPGRYNPKNEASPLFGEIRPMRPCKIEGMTDDFLWHDLFHGYLVESESEPDMGTNEARFQFQDLTVWLDREKTITIASTGATTVGAAIGLILDEIGWIEPSKRDLAVGESIPDFSASNAGALDLIADLLQVDLGYFFITREGVATYREPLLDTVAIGIFEAAAGVVPGASLATVRNRAVSQKTGNAEQIALDTASQDEFGTADDPKVESPYFTNDAAALAHAEFRVAQHKDPVSPLWSFTVSEGPEGYLPEILQADLLDATMISTAGMNQQRYNIEKIVHRGNTGKLHLTDWRLREGSEFEAARVGTATVAPNDPELWVGYDRITY